MISYGQLPILPELGLRPNMLKWVPARPALAYDNPTGDIQIFKAWRTKARRQMNLCLGDEIPQVDPRPKVLERVQLDGYSRTTFTLATAPGMRALCWLLLPDGAGVGAKLPAMIATPGHGIGAKDLIGLDEKGNPREEGKGYQKDYGLAAVRHGIATLVIEPLGFGERRDYEMAFPEYLESGCHAASSIATMLGTTLARIRLHDIQRGIDYLQNHPAIDSSRIGLMGISGGGQMTLWTMAMEPRLKLAIVSGYFNTFKDSVMGMHHCICNFVPGMAKYFDMVDLAMMAYPRPLLIQSGTQDHIFPLKAAKKAIRELTSRYAKLGEKKRIEVDIFEGPHMWSPAKVNTFLDRWL